MNLEPQPFDHDRELPVSPADLSVLLSGVALRQGASATASSQAAMDAAPPLRTPFNPLDGSFNAGVKAALDRWKDA